MWCYGQLGDESVGWFPKSYVKIEVTNGQNVTAAAGNGLNEYYISLYQYASNEAGDLNFNHGEIMLVTKKDGDWWTGVIGDRTGIFPSNYVEKYEIPNKVSYFIQTSVMIHGVCFFSEALFMYSIPIAINPIVSNVFEFLRYSSAQKVRKYHFLFFIYLINHVVVFLHFVVEFQKLSWVSYLTRHRVQMFSHDSCDHLCTTHLMS